MREAVRSVGEDGGDEGEVVLVLEEVLRGGCGGGGVEGIVERRVEGAEGELGDVVREVEGCPRRDLLLACLPIRSAWIEGG